MGNVVGLSNIIILRGVPTDLMSAVGHQFVVDCVRAGEGLITDADIKDKYEISSDEFEKITKNTALIRAIRSESERRVRNSTAARESAAKISVRAPQVLGTILDDKSASPRHRIESARELRATATGPGAESAAAAGEKFIITINLSGDGTDHIEHYEKPLKPMKPLAPVIEDKTDDE